jgi:hypothetical protein
VAVREAVAPLLATVGEAGVVETRTRWLQESVSRVPATPTMRGLLQRLSRDKKAVVRARAEAHATALRKRC